ncbi:MAG: AraC family transcriptional regulator [Lachnospiraceae bacterium]|nr:AraC family transcriptional regulator [Lachnospiraceae bacterium]
MEEYEIVEHLQMEDLNLFLVSLSYRSPHMHKEFEICMVLSGQVIAYAGQETQIFEKGDLFLFNPRQSHELHALTENVVMISVQVASGFCMRVYPEIRRLEFDRIRVEFTQGQEQKERIRRQVLQIARFYLEKKKNYEFFCMAGLYGLFGDLLCSQSWRIISEKEQDERYYKGERLKRITDYIENHFTEKVMLTEIAEMENLSMHYLSHFFREMLGLSFQEYVALLRFERARRLVERTNKSITEICLECGFSDYRYLNKIYKKQLGYTPMEYRCSHTPLPVVEKEENIMNTQTFYSIHESLEILSLAAGSSMFREKDGKAALIRE